MSIKSFYSNGDLARALIQAAEFVARIDGINVIHVIARQDADIPGAWWVDVVYAARIDQILGK